MLDQNFKSNESQNDVTSEAYFFRQSRSAQLASFPPKPLTVRPIYQMIVS